MKKPCIRVSSYLIKLNERLIEKLLWNQEAKLPISRSGRKSIPINLSPKRRCSAISKGGGEYLSALPVASLNTLFKNHSDPSVHGRKRYHITDRSLCEWGCGGHVDQRRCPLRGYWIWDSLLAWEEHKGAGNGAHRHRPSEVQTLAHRSGEEVQPYL